MMHEEARFIPSKSGRCKIRIAIVTPVINQDERNSQGKFDYARDACGVVNLEHDENFLLQAMAFETK